MKTHCNNTLRILDVMHQNLKFSSPKALHIDDLSMKLELKHAYLKDILLRMGHSGDIICSSEGHYSIITKKGLQNYLESSFVSEN